MALRKELSPQGPPRCALAPGRRIATWDGRRRPRRAARCEI
jgi:hypothetical protein